MVAAGAPGGSHTIIIITTTVAQVRLGYVDRDLDLVDAIATPRLSSRNGTEDVDLGLLDTPTGQAPTDLGHELTSRPWISNASGIAFEGQQLVAATETVRGDAGSARTVRRGSRLEVPSGGALGLRCRDRTARLPA